MWNMAILGALAIVGLGLGWREWRQWQARRRLPSWLAGDAQIVDVRSGEEFATGACPGSINAPYAQLPAGLENVERHRPVILCCATGTRAEGAVLILRRAGYTDVVNGGGWRDVARRRAQGAGGSK
jgi:phage shock protein E